MLKKLVKIRRILYKSLLKRHKNGMKHVCWCPFLDFSGHDNLLATHSKLSRIAYGCGEDYINRKSNTEPTDELKLTEC